MMTMTSTSVQARYPSSLKMDKTGGYVQYPRGENMDSTPETERKRERGVEATEVASKEHHYHGRKTSDVEGSK